MINDKISNKAAEITSLCLTVKALNQQHEYQKSEVLIAQAMGQYPHAPEPHNLMGILLETYGDHPMAMKHFRAAWALDPTYLPARVNLNQYADMYGNDRTYAYVAEDCPTECDLYACKSDREKVSI